ncbi:hypothetical protein HETIRDRAFT_100471 [Heterobasidion irregulare TC 32-1]|uniref:Uncharacterized protein n=1 Tax=Heterobasidion irregulare (strain TC 32-1) TaxID=747525 RepID=W4KJU4_HETIT|nr:uncharacterized protein HETIRDRAFT_100471 [Heterobasidion irregulare TC 32-1]ETW85974.1 hypothetical protein HETIRDRAFT_100471 [Heterobasidion irregulare TC 32-1]
MPPHFANTVSGAAIVGTYALAKGRGQAVAALLASSAALNCGIAGATFFGIREYLVQAHPEDGIHRGHLTWWDMRTHNVLDSLVSGGITGGILRAWRHGSRGGLSGLAMGAVGCTLLQYSANELGIQRVKFVSRRLGIATPGQQPVGSSEPTRPLGQRIAGLLGFKSLSDEQFIAQMKQDRDTYMKRIAELEKLQEEEKGRR